MPDPMPMAELRATIEKIHNNSPQRLQLARTHLDSLAQALKGLETMGQKLAFTILPPPPPIEYPKALYFQKRYKVANNSMEEILLREQGYCPLPTPEPNPEPEPVPVGDPPIFSVTIGGRHGN